MLSLACAAAFAASASPALADDPAPSSSTDSPAPPPKKKAVGFAVTTAGPTADATWPVAQAVYRSSLRPPTLDEARARVLAGEPAAEAASADVRELAELRAGVHGDDAASRQLLAAISAKLEVEGVVVLFAEGDAVEARVYLSDARAFDAARYRRDVAAGWGPLVASLERSRPGVALAPPPPVRPDPRATAPTTLPKPRAPESERARPFYVSPWFWGAIGAAAFAGGAVYFATRDSDSGQIRLQMRVPQ
ncbi:MAG: hypothetical protein JNL38_05440 [Myxococcales bacterium]|nr:hypothetical protein [Myxococcales bacterium]